MLAYDCCVVVMCNTETLVTSYITKIMLSLIKYNIVQRGRLVPPVGRLPLL